MPTVPPPQGAAIAAGTLARAARRWRHLVIALGIGCLGWCATPGLANQLPKADVRAEMDRANAKGRGDYRFPLRLASGELVMVEVHSTPTVIDGRSLLLSVLLPESRTILQQQELQRDQTWLEALVAERTAQAIRAEAERSRMLAWSLAGALAAVVALSLAVALLRRGARRQRELDDELQDVLRGARLGRMRWDLVRNTISLGPRLRRQLGLDEHTPQDIPAQTWQQWLHPDDAPQVQRVLQAHLKGDSEVADLRVRVQHRAGHWIWLQAWWRVVARDPATGRATMIAGVLRDVSDEVALAQSRAIAASVFEDAGEAIIVTDERGTVLEVNSALLQMGGYTRDELIGRADLPWRPADRHGMPSWHRLRRQLQRGGRWRGQAWWRRRDGTEFPVIEAISAVRDERGRVIRYVVIAQDITELKAQQQALERQAHYDLVTGLPNRALLADRLDLAIASARRHRRRVAVAYLDLDDFKAINDAHSHELGDRILRAVAQRLQGVLREGDTLAHVGGDEFVAVLCDLDDSDRWRLVIERLLAAIAEPIECDGTRVPLTTSIGVTLFPDDGADAEVLLRHADQALYRAKREGKNRWRLFDPREDRAAAAHAELIADVQRALLSGTEFQLYLQPRVGLVDGAVQGAEALLRWQHPQRGLLLPGAFLPAIEQDDVMIALGEWVLDEAMRQLQRWHDAGLPPWILSVNIAPRQLRDPAFVERLAQRLARHPQVDRRRLEIEIVESSALDGIDALESLLERCRALGVAVAIDDFGTGYSSLSYLKRLPASVVKIDQSFVRNLFDDANDLRIIEGIVALGQAFGLQVVAEGVETLAHGELLLRLGADAAQGYGIARPMPAADWLTWVETWHAPTAWTRWRAMAHSPWSRVLARLEVEHRALLSRLLNREAAPGPAAACTFDAVLSETVPPKAKRWPEYVAVQDAHRAFHDAAQRWWETPGDSDAHHESAVERAHQALLDALHALMDRLIEPSNGHDAAAPTASVLALPPPAQNPAACCS